MNIADNVGDKVAQQYPQLVSTHTQRSYNRVAALPTGLWLFVGRVREVSPRPYLVLLGPGAPLCGAGCPNVAPRRTGQTPRFRSPHLGVRYHCHLGVDGAQGGWGFGDSLLSGATRFCFSGGSYFPPPPFPEPRTPSRVSPGSGRGEGLISVVSARPEGSWSRGRWTDPR